VHTYHDGIGMCNCPCGPDERKADFSALFEMQMYISYPISYPIAKLLDKVLGHDEGVTYKRQGLKTFVSLHRHLGAETLLDDEVTIISAVLELSEKSVKDIMTPIADIYSLSSEQVLDEDTVMEVGVSGLTRVENKLRLIPS
jgi:metal transporter CNNM